MKRYTWRYIARFLWSAFPRNDYEKEDHKCFKASKEDDIEVTSLTYDQIFKLNVKLIQDNEALEKRIIDIKEYIEFVENRNKFLVTKLLALGNESI